MILLIFFPIIMALIIFLFKKSVYIRVSFISFIIEGILIAKLYDRLFASNFLEVIIGDWPRQIGISLKLTHYNFIFLSLILVAWIASSLYAFEKRSKDYKFYFFLHFLRGTFYALVLSNDLFNTFVLIEIITVISTILIIYKKDGFSLRAGVYYLMFNSIGMIFYILGIILIYLKIGTLNIDYLNRLPMDSTTQVALALIITALGIKSAFFPVYTWTWLPRAHMAAPSSMSALLSSVLVKTGFIVLIKLFTVLPEGLFFRYLFIMGALKAISGMIFAFCQRDIKGLLAFSTISQAGLILMVIGGGGVLQISGIFHLVNHSLFKSLMFLSVGIIIKEYGTRRIDEVKGLFKEYPLLSMFLIIGILSVLGFPLSSGFVSKSLMKEGLKQSTMALSIFYLIDFGTFLYYMKLIKIFLGKGNRVGKTVKSKIHKSLFFIGGLAGVAGGFEFFILKNHFHLLILPDFSDFYMFIFKCICAYLIYYYINGTMTSSIRTIRHYQIGFRKANIVLVVFLIVTILFIY